MSDSNLDAATSPAPNHRFMAWAGLCFFSIVTLASHLSATRETGRDRDDWFVVVVASVSAVCSFATLMAYFTITQTFAGGALEAILAILSAIFWVSGMPFIMDPAREIAVSKGNSGTIVMTEEGTAVIENRLEFTFIKNANIYFFSWASTICIVYICGRFARDFIMRRRKARALNKSVHVFAPETNMWYLLTVSALVMLVDSIEIYTAFSCSGSSSEPDLCMRTKYAVALGSIGTGIGFVCSVCATIGKLNLYLELFVSIVLFGMYIAGVALITFNDGPGTSLGNLYFATWLGAVVTLVMVGSTYQDTVHSFQDTGVVPEEPKPEKSAEFPDDIEWGKSEDNPAAAKEEVSPSPAPATVKADPKVDVKPETKADEDIEVGKAVTKEDPPDNEETHEEEVTMEDYHATAEGSKESPMVEEKHDEAAEDDVKSVGKKQDKAVEDDAKSVEEKHDKAAKDDAKSIDEKQAAAEDDAKSEEEEPATDKTDDEAVDETDAKDEAPDSKNETKSKEEKE